MDWNDLKVMSIYGIVLAIVLLILGQVGFAVMALIGYPLYGLLCCIKKYRDSKKLYNELDFLNDETLKKILESHFFFRAQKLKKRVRRAIINDIRNQNYTIETEQLTKKRYEPDDDGGYHYLSFTNMKERYVSNTTYGNCREGDTLYIIKTSTEKIMVINSGAGYINLF